MDGDKDHNFYDVSREFSSLIIIVKLVRFFYKFRWNFGLPDSVVYEIVWFHFENNAAKINLFRPKVFGMNYFFTNPLITVKFRKCEEIIWGSAIHNLFEDRQHIFFVVDLVHINVPKCLLA